MEIIYETIIPKKGAITINAIILRTPPITTDPKPAFAIAAPTSPPTSVCDELEGNPHHQVIKFHAIDATKAAAITDKLITSGFTTPLPMVVATFSGKITKAIKLKNAAIVTAETGDRTFVDTTVAIEFAES